MRKRECTEQGNVSRCSTERASERGGMRRGRYRLYCERWKDSKRGFVGKVMIWQDNAAAGRRCGRKDFPSLSVSALIMKGIRSCESEDEEDDSKLRGWY